MHMARMRKNHYLFLSGKCEYSRKLVVKIEKYLDFFTVVNIDDPNVRIPQYVQYVPCLVMQQEGKVLKENELYARIDFIINGLKNMVEQQDNQRPQHVQETMNTGQNRNTGNNNINRGYEQITGLPNIMPIDDSMGGPYSDRYSVITNENDDLKVNNNALKKSFEYLSNDGFTNNDIITNIPFSPNQQVSATGDKGKKSGIDYDKQMENLLKQRKLDIQM